MTTLLELLDIKDINDIDDADKMREVLSRILTKKGTLYLGISVNDVMFNKPEVKIRKVRNFCKWLKDFEDLLKDMEFPHHDLVNDMARKYLYTRLIDSKYRHVLLKFPPSSTVLEVQPKVSKKMKKFLEDNSQTYRATSDSILFASAADCHLFILANRDDKHKMTAHYMQKLVEPVDAMIAEIFNTM